MPRAKTIDEKRDEALSKLSSTVAADSTKEKASATDGRPSRRRGVFNGTESKLKVSKQIPGFHLHVFNDTPGRIDAALENGYEFVSPEEIGRVTTNVVSRNTDLTDKVRFLVGTAESGGPLYGYLMKIKQEWWEEDQQELQERNNRIDAALKKGKVGDINTEGFYVPKGGIKISNS